LAVKERALDMLEAEIARKIRPGKRLPHNGALSARAAEDGLQKLAGLYLAFASEHPKLWQAVFEHRSPDPIVPDAYMAKLDGVLRHVERPFEILKERGRDYLAADIFLTAARLGGDAAINRGTIKWGEIGQGGLDVPAMRGLVDSNFGGEILHEVRSAAQTRAVAAAGATNRLSPMDFGLQGEGSERIGVAATVQEVLAEGAPPRFLDIQFAGHAWSLRAHGSQETPAP
jgi:hypothetical protein